MISDVEFAAWLKRDSSKRCVLVEMDYQEEGGSPPSPVTKTLCLSTMPFFGENNDSPPTVTAWKDWIKSVPEYSRSLSTDTLGTYSSSIGTLEIANPDGRADFILDLAIDGSALRFKLGDPSWDASDFRLIFSALSVMATAPSIDRISVTLKDTGLLLDQSIGGTVKVGGTGPNADKWRKVNFGLVHQVEADLLDQSTLGYADSDTGDGRVTVLSNAKGVFDRGIPVEYVDNGDGTFNLLHSPDGNITCLLLYSAGTGVEHWCTSDHMRHFVGERCGLVDAGLYAGPGPTFETRPDTAVEAFIVAGGEDYKLGVSISEKRNVIDLLQEITDSGLCFWAIRRDGQFTFGRLRPNYIAGLGVASVKTFTKDSFIGNSFRVDPIQPKYFQFQATMSRNWSIQTDLASSLSPDERGTFTRTGLYAIQYDGVGLDSENAPQLYHKTLVESPQIDTLLSGADDTEDDPKLRLWMDVRRAMQLPWLQVASGTVGIDAYAVELGDPATVQMDRFGFDDGVEFQCVGINIKLPNKVDIRLLRRDVQVPYAARSSVPPDIAPYAGPARVFAVDVEFIPGEAYATSAGAGLAVAQLLEVAVEFLPGVASGRIEGDGGGGGGSGSVTSVGMTVPSEFSVAGSPVTSAGSLDVSWANPVAITHGGTNAATAIQAFTNLSPQTTKGDLIVDDGTNPSRLSVAADGKFLGTDSSDPLGVSWQDIPAQGVLQSQKFTSSGTFNVPNGVSGVWVNMIGAGAGGGNRGSTLGGPGGGSGETAIDMPIAVTSGAAIAVTIGTKGTGAVSGGTGAAGTDGGDTSFGAVFGVKGGKGGPNSASGGAGGGTKGAAGVGNATGVVGAAESAVHFGGSSGGGGGTTSSSAGAAGGGAPGFSFGGAGGATVSTQGGAGGGAASMYGNGGAGGAGGSAGSSAASTAYGAGGGGAGGHATTTLAAGNGADGYCEVFWVS